jgi:hypothetical protein
LAAPRSCARLMTRQSAAYPLGSRATMGAARADPEPRPGR